MLLFGETELTLTKATLLPFLGEEKPTGALGKSLIRAHVGEIDERVYSKGDPEPGALPA